MRVSLRSSLVRMLMIASPSCVAFFIDANAYAQDHATPLPTYTPPKRAAAPAASGTVSGSGSAGWGIPPAKQAPPTDVVAPAVEPSTSTSTTGKSVKITYEEGQTSNTAAPPKEAPSDVASTDRSQADKANDDTKKGDKLAESHFLHGFRIGYSFVANYDKPLASLDGKTFKEKAGVRSPHNFLLGYEVLIRMMGHSWLNVILLANGILGGLEQSKVLPSGNALIGFEFNNSFQVGVGAHLTPLKGQEAHVAIAGGWTPRVGGFYIPVHAFFIPDVDGNHRTGMLTGVTW